MSAQDPDHAETEHPTPSPESEMPVASSEGEGFWSAYWERFRRQQVDDPVAERREGMWDRFKRQDIDDPVEERRKSRPG